MITYVLTISQKFPNSHNRKGQETNFYPLILRGQKKHTIRGNYNLWAKRFEKIDKGLACLSIRMWGNDINAKSGKSGAYHSKQIELMVLDNTKGIGIQKLIFKEMIMTTEEVLETKSKEGLHIWKPNLSNISTLATNDGLSLDDFKDWFKGYDLSKEMAIIHFTDFRYSK